LGFGIYSEKPDNYPDVVPDETNWTFFNKKSKIEFKNLYISNNIYINESTRC
jgi:hypothetical protein